MILTRRSLQLASVLLLCASLAAQPNRPTTAAGADWPTYNRDLAGTRFSPLTDINTDNVGKLTQAWSYTMQLGGGGGLGGGGSQAVPLVVNGIMYLPAGNKVVALEPESGRVIWEYTLPSGQASRRGLAYWPGDGKSQPRLLFTSGRRIIALNINGEIVSSFGKQGEVDTDIAYNSAPVIYRNVAIIGAQVNELPVGPPGDTRAYDVRTGEKLWEFHTVARPGEVGHETWLDEGWKGRSGANVWGFSMTVDEARGLVYMPIGGPATNYWGGDRPGNNLFSNSIVAVDAQTGKYRWHFQTVHHDIWDSDQPSPPGLLDIVVNGKRIPALTVVGKTSYMFILDRTNGRPVHGVEERPVPKGDVPGEWYSPTQPFPVKPPALARVSFTKADMVTEADTTAEHVAACQALWDKSGGFSNAGPFTPFMYHEDGTPPKSTIQFPGGTGGINWGGTATDPRSGYVFMNSHDTSLVGWVEKRKPGVEYSFESKGATHPYERASVNGPGPFFTFSAPLGGTGTKTPNLPCQRPPWARLVAVNANMGDIAWQTTLGLTEALPEGKRNTGNSGSAGPTVTAGGLVFVGATNDSRFRAFDSKTGRELWVTRLERSANANPISYQAKNGKQYVAVVAGDAIVAFALP